MKLTKKENNRLLKSKFRNEMLFDFKGRLLTSLNKVSLFYYNQSIWFKPSYSEVLRFCSENLNPTDQEIMQFFMRTHIERGLLKELTANQPKEFTLKESLWVAK